MSASAPAPAVRALPSGFEDSVWAEAEGRATPEQIEALRAHAGQWQSLLWILLDRAEDALDDANRLRGPERAQVLADLQNDWERLDAALTRLVGPPDGRHGRGGSGVEGAGIASLQLSWRSGQVVAWAAGHLAPSDTVDELMVRLDKAGAPTSGWQPHAPVRLPTGDRVDALALPIGEVLGWLTAVGAEPGAYEVGASVRWMGRVAVLAVEHVAQGRMVPQLQRHKRRRGEGNDRSQFQVEWVPALIESDELNQLATTLPGAVSVLDTGADPRTVAQAAVSDVVDAICRNAAKRLEVPAPPPDPTTKQDVAEAMLARLDGSEFEAPSRFGAELVRRLEQWARPVTSPTKLSLVVQLHPPDDAGAWHLEVLAPGADRSLEAVEVAMVTASNTRRKEVRDHLDRLERLLPVLLRPGSHRRGQVVLSQDEAWELMTRTGESLVAAGFDLRVPALSRRKPSAALRLTAEEAGPSVVGAQQLANVRWSAVFDDVELDAAEIARLASQARPLVRSRGQWVELDHADLREAAAALAERARKTQLTGAEMLRHALGLEGSPLAGGVLLSGEGWAADLLRSAGEVPDDPDTSPEGFTGELRRYQAEALAWLRFLDRAGLGGCLALDMGLGKTPTMLAHLRAGMGGEHPSLVIAPPAVVGNWASEARKFTKAMRVLVHHGPNRADPRDIARAVGRADIVLTTYGTAVRDIDELAALDWNCVVLDEAQIIKNPTSETAQQLRRFEARTRVALTGTPIENGLGDLWAIMDFVNPGLVGPRAHFVSQLSEVGATDASAESALRALNGILVFRRTKAEPAIAAELPDRIDELDHCTMTAEQIGLYQAVLDKLVLGVDDGGKPPKGQVLAAITALKQICNHPAAYQDDGEPLAGRSGKLTRLEEIIESVFASDERVLVFTHFAQWGDKLARYLSQRFATRIECYHGGLARGARDRMVADFQAGKGAGALVLSLKAGGTGLNLTAASHVVLYDRWWNPAVEDQARDRVWRIGQTRTVIAHRLVCPGTIDERVEEVVAGKRRVADLVLPKSSSLDDLDRDQLRQALGLRSDELLTDDDDGASDGAAA